MPRPKSALSKPGLVTASPSAAVSLKSLAEHLQLSPAEPDLDDWQDLVDRMSSPVGTVRIALVGKYVDLQDPYHSVREALRHAGAHLRVAVDIQWIASDAMIDDG